MNNIAGLTYGMFPSMYNNQIALNDLSGLDLYNPMLSMDGSIFGMPMSPMMGMPFTGFGGMNYDQYYKNYDEYQDFMINSRMRQQQKWRDADLHLNSPLEGIKKQAANVHEKIMRNEQQQIQEAYNNFRESVRRLYGNASEQEINDRAATLYTQIIGKTIYDDIRNYGRDSFTQGLYQTLSLGIADGTTAEENISQITGQPVGRREKIKKIAGNATGGAVIGAGGALALNAIWKAKGPIAKALCKIPVLAAIGGVIAGVVAFSKGK